ncbi:hypothetical protein [Bordetella flabilis]|uniref:hypothetical protein n=1 Tax=Bordetella flabilis TaxID=463014 RepID=UPI000AA0C7AC|nr:hypothetical protein [Bordetella flabilis]
MNVDRIGFIAGKGPLSVTALRALLPNGDTIGKFVTILLWWPPGRRPDFHAPRARFPFGTNVDNDYDLESLSETALIVIPFATPRWGSQRQAESQKTRLVPRFLLVIQET